MKGSLELVGPLFLFQTSMNVRMGHMVAMPTLSVKTLWVASPVYVEKVSVEMDLTAQVREI